MAEKEKIIFEVEVVTDESVKDLERLKVAITQNREEQKQLQKDYREGRLSVEAFAKESVKLETQLKKDQDAFRKTQQSVTGVKTKFDELIDSNKQLVETNKSIASTLLSSIPGLDKFKGGINGITTAFKANPIGLAITAFLALKGIFEQNAVVADKLSFIFSGITKGLGFVIDTVVETVSSFSKLKEAIFSPIQFFSDLTKGTTDAAKAGYEAAESIDAFGLASAKAERAIKLTQVSIDSLEKSLKDKTKSEQERIKIATEIADLEIANAKRREDLAAQELANEQKRLKDKTLSGAEETALYKLETEVFNQQQQTRTIIAHKQSRINILTAKEEAAAIKAERDALSESDIRRIENQKGFEVTALETTSLKKLEIKGNFVTKNTEVEIKQTEEQRIQEEVRLANTKKQLEEEQKAKEQAQRRELAFTANSLGQLSTLFKKNTLANQATAAAQALINTFLGVTEILGQKSTLPSPLDYITKAINVAAVLGSGLKAVTGIKSAGISAAAGGGNFLTKGPTMLLVGDNPGGVERVTVEPLSGKGQTRVAPGGNLIAMAGGGTLTTSPVGTFETSSASLMASQNRIFSDMMRAFKEQRIVLPLDDFEIKQETKVQIQTTGQVI
jgi:hypothetical protein